MNLDYVVQVVCTELRLGSEFMLSLGTGYLIGKRRILTAAHVVKSTKKRPATIRVRRRGESEWCTATCAVHVYEVDGPNVLEHVDLSILVCDRDLLTSDPKVRIGFGAPPPQSIWRAAGYPLTGVSVVDLPLSDAPESSSAQPMDGIVLDVAATDAFMPLRVEGPPKDWPGMSGAAAFVGDELFGVVRTECPQYRIHGENSTRIHATLLRSRSKDSAFCAELGATSTFDSGAAVESYRRRFRDILARSSTAEAVLLSILKRKNGPEKAKSDLTESMLSMTTVDAIFLIFEAYRDLTAGGIATRVDAAPSPEERRQAANAMVAILQVLLPIGVNWQRVADIDRRKLSGHSIKEVMKEGDGVLAEMLMSAVDGRPYLGLVGFDGIVTEHQIDLRSSRQLDDANSSDFVAAVVGHLSKFAAATAITEKGATSAVREWLHWRRSRRQSSPCSYYLVYLKTGVERDEARIKALQDELPELPIIVIEGRLSPTGDDAELSVTVRELIKLHGGGSA